ncbi:MAG: Ldh family oxidoreductase [Chloroflexota bacterium]|nr:MAG: Ldh family oxidoreductase [Chloroflexota bacterium]
MANRTAKELRAVTEAVFVAAGATRDTAAEMGEALVGANLAGHDSHGVIRIPAYVKAIQDGSLDPAARPAVIQETPTSALVDGRWSFGHVAARFGTNVAIKKAKASRTAVVSIVRCNHIGRLGQWASQASAEDVIAMVVVGGAGGSEGRMGQGIAAPFGGAERALSTNPISIGFPGGEMPDMLIDFATTVVAEGKVQVARAKGADLPPGCIVDKDGHPSVDPNDFYAGGALLPFGGHKGYALAMFVEMLCGAMTPGDVYNGAGRRGGAVVWAVDALTFRDRASYEHNADHVLRRIKRIRPAEGVDEVLLPGEPEARSARARLAEGVPVADATWSQIIDAGKLFGVDVEAVARNA